MEQPETTREQPVSPDENGPLLSLDTLIERKTIEIDGARFEILHPDELSIIDSHRLGVWGRRIQELAEVDGEEAEEKLDTLVDRVARKVSVGVPDEVYAKLKGGHKQKIADVFTGLLLRDRLGVAGAIAKAAGIPVESAGLSIGAKSSPGSSASMAESRNGGFMKRLSRWCGLT